jgi:translin
MNLENNFADITEELDKYTEIRENILNLQRKIVSDCSVAIKNIHRQEYENYHKKIALIEENLADLHEMVEKKPGIFFKYLKTAEQEYTEAVCFYRIINEEEIPSRKELNVYALHYATGMADIVGELRRHVLDNIRNSNVEQLNKMLEMMDEIYTYLFSLDYPSGLTKDLRHKTDVARKLIEKTRGDISLTIQMNELKKFLKTKK